MSEQNNIINQLRSTLGKQFPNARHRVDETPDAGEQAELVARQLPAASFTECCTASPEIGAPSLLPSGHGLVLAALLSSPQSVPDPLPHTVLIDACNSFNPASFPADQIQRALWVRCHSCTEALHACDIVLRDPNLPLVIADFSLTPATELRKVPTTLWYRLRRLIDTSGSAVVALTSQPAIPAATRRFTLTAPHGINHDLHHRSDLLGSPWLTTPAAASTTALRA